MRIGLRYKCAYFGLLENDACEKFYFGYLPRIEIADISIKTTNVITYIRKFRLIIIMVINFLLYYIL